MSIPDPFAPLNGGVLHRVDIKIAESVTGVRNKSISSHAADPLVRRGAKRSNAVAGLHWLGIGALLVVGAAAYGASKKR